MVTAAFMDAKQIMSMPYTWIPSSKYFTTSTRTFFTNFQKAIVGNHGDNIFFRNLFNSLIVASVCSITTVFLASLCGFGLAKYKFKGQKAVFMAIMSTMMIPFEAIMIPLYLVATKMKIINTIPGLIIPFLVSALVIPDEHLSRECQKPTVMIQRETSQPLDDSPESLGFLRINEWPFPGQVHTRPYSDTREVTRGCIVAPTLESRG